MTKVMGHVFQDECQEKHLSGCSFWFIMDKEIGKGNGKGFEKAKMYY